MNTPFLYLIIAFSLNSIANILLKLKAKQGGFELSDLSFWSLISNNFLFLAGIFLFAVNVVFYFLALRSVPLSTAYPVMTIMSFLIINSYAYFFIGEEIGIMQIVGYLFIIIGIIFIFYFSK